jgi:hypothetical protein
MFSSQRWGIGSRRLHGIPIVVRLHIATPRAVIVREIRLPRADPTVKTHHPNYLNTTVFRPCPAFLGGIVRTGLPFELPRYLIVSIFCAELYLLVDRLQQIHSHFRSCLRIYSTQHTCTAWMISEFDTEATLASTYLASRSRIKPRIVVASQR